MADAILQLKGRGGDDDARRSVFAAHQRIGLDGLLRELRPSGRRVSVPAAAAEEGFRWGWREQFSGTWWPQGIDVRRHGDGWLILISWFAQKGRQQLASRITVVHLQPRRRPRIAHVALVEPAPDGSLLPIAVHAGGIAWHGDRIYVADTFGGLRVFDTADVIRVRRARGRGYALPQLSGFEASTGHGARRMRYSFVSLEDASTGPQLVVGEYRNDTDDSRLARFRLGSDGDVIGSATVEVHVPNVRRMQGACVVDGVWCVTTSEGTRAGGDLWVGTPSGPTRHRGVLTPGPEDLAHERGTHMVWTLGEWPGRRYVYRIDLDRWTPVTD
ncbi:MAG: hypothetical protein ABI632_06380 [Pseudolysinimonas sp.]